MRHATVAPDPRRCDRADPRGVDGLHRPGARRHAVPDAGRADDLLRAACQGCGRPLRGWAQRDPDLARWCAAGRGRHRQRVSRSAARALRSPGPPVRRAIRRCAGRLRDPGAHRPRAAGRDGRSLGADGTDHGSRGLGPRLGGDRARRTPATPASATATSARARPAPTTSPAPPTTSAIRPSSPRGLGGRVELRADVHYPTDLSAGPYPLVLFLHGNHAACYRGDRAGYSWPCPRRLEAAAQLRGLRLHRRSAWRATATSSPA